MNEFLNSIKADLLDRRLLPLVAVVAVGFVAAVAYVALGGGSSASTPSTATVTEPASPFSRLAISHYTPETAVAETTAGTSLQRGGIAHNPFVPLSESKPSVTTAGTRTGSSGSSGASSATITSSSASSAPTSSSSTPSSSTSSQGSTQSEASTPSQSSPKPSKAKPAYDVAVLFGVVPAGASKGENLNSFGDLTLNAPLPSAQERLIVFKGAGSAGKTVSFALSSEPILHGNADCMPSASQCETIKLHAGQSEQFEYASPTGETVTYELKVVSITPATGEAKASAASAASAKGGARAHSARGANHRR